MKRLLIVILISFSGILKGVAQDNWKLYKETPQVAVYYQTKICPIPRLTKGSKEKYLLKLVNKSDHEIQVSWYFNTWISNRCLGCDDEKEFYREVLLSPHETLAAGCEAQKDLQITIRMIDVPGAKSKIEKVELSKFNVSVKEK